MEYELYEIELIEEINEAIKSMESQLSRVSASGANPQLINNLKISYYDELTPIGDLCSITIPEAQQLIVKPFDDQIIKDIYKIIEKQNYSISIVDEGKQLRIIFPILTTDKRKEAVKKLSIIKENAKIKLRNSRHSILKNIKNNEDLSEDILKDFKNRIQKKVDFYNEKIDQKIKEKEENLMKF